MPKYQNSGKYGGKQRYNRSLKDVYRSLQNLYKRIDQLQRYKNSGSSSSGSYGYKPRMMSRYSSERHPEKYTKQKVEPRYVVKTEAPKYRIETPRFQTSAEQLAEETERKIEAKLKPLLEGIDRKLGEEKSTSVEIQSENTQIEKPQTSLEELRTHALELREFEDIDWNGSREDAEFLWNMRDALVHSIEMRDPNLSEPNIENQKIEAEPLIPEAIHGTELSTEFKLAPQSELKFDETDFFALESELFGLEKGIEAEAEDEIEGGPL